MSVNMLYFYLTGVVPSETEALILLNVIAIALILIPNDAKRGKDE